MNRILSLTTGLLLSCTLLCAGVGPGPGTTAPAPAVSATAPSSASASAASTLSPSVALSTESTPSPANSPETLAEAKRQLAELNLTKAEKRAARRELKRMVKDMIAQRRAESRSETLTASVAPAAASPVNRARSDLRYRLIIGLIGIAGAIIFYAVGEPVAGTILLIAGLFFFGWWLIDYL